jgi:CIC family chloride channel protein
VVDMNSPQTTESFDSNRIPSTLKHPRARHFWFAVVLIGITTGIGAALLTKLLELVQRVAWRGSSTDILAAAQKVSLERHVLILLGAALLTGAGQLLLKRLSSGNGIDTTEAIWFQAGRMPPLRTLGIAVLSILIVGMGVSLGREGAPKQAGAVFANLFSDKERLSDEQRQLLVACGAGAGMGAAYGVPLGGALFALEVMRGKLALRYVLPALFTSLIATGISWLVLPDAPTYVIPSFSDSASVLLWTLIAGPLLGLASVGYVRMIAWADRNRPNGWTRFAAPLIVMGLLGFISYWFPQILGNGKDLSELLFTSQVAPMLMLPLLFLKPIATTLCIRSGAPGGMFTPSLTAGALLGGVLGAMWSVVWPGTPPGLFALLGAGAMIAATTQGPISAVVLLMELTGRDRAFVLPLLLMVCGATLIARTIEPRSIYDARLTDEQIAERQRLRDLPSQ